MTWAPLLERLSGLLGDLPTRLALAGLAGFVAVIVGLLRWVNHHYVRSIATGWQLTTWENIMKAERRAARRRLDHQAGGWTADEPDWEEVT